METSGAPVLTPAPPSAQTPIPGNANEILNLLSDTFGRCEPIDFAIQLWDGQTWGPAPGQPQRFTLVIHHPGAFRRLLVHPDLFSLGEGYVQELYDLQGDLDAALQLAERLMERAPGFLERVRHALQTSPLLRSNVALELTGFADPEVLGGLPRAQRASNYHYDQPLEFWKSWLTADLQYSCGCFASPGETLERAQERQMDRICRKLALQQDERLLDIGCGWGALVRYAARCYGARVTGITLSEKQAEYANAQIRREGLQDRCRVEVTDFRRWCDAEYHKIVSVDMIEHIPQVLQHQYFEQVRELIRPGGLFLNQSITCSAIQPARGGADFIDKYVFPDSQLIPISTMLRIAESTGWEIREMENLREHYALTLDAWRERLERNMNALRPLVPETTLRVFRLYLGGAAADFRAGGLSVHQTLLACPAAGRLSLPLLRDAQPDDSRPATAPPSIGIEYGAEAAGGSPADFTQDKEDPPTIASRGRRLANALLRTFQSL